MGGSVSTKEPPIRVRLNAKGLSRGISNRNKDAVGVVIGILVQWKGKAYWDMIDHSELVKVPDKPSAVGSDVSENQV